MNALALEIFFGGGGVEYRLNTELFVIYVYLCVYYPDRHNRDMSE
jgi:hypothetical protein